MVDYNISVVRQFTHFQILYLFCLKYTVAEYIFILITVCFCCIIYVRSTFRHAIDYKSFEHFAKRYLLLKVLFQFIGPQAVLIQAS